MSRKRKDDDDQPDLGLASTHEIDLAEPVSRGKAKIVGRPSVSADKADPEALDVTCRVRIALDSVDDARRWHGGDTFPVFPALDEYWRIGTADDATTRYTLAWRRDGEAEVVLRLWPAANGHAEPLGGPAILLGARATLSQKGARVDVSVRLVGVRPEALALLPKLLGAEVDVEVENRQIRLFDGDGEKVGTRDGDVPEPE